MRFKNLLTIKNITQNDLAKKLGVTQSLISQWISGKCQPQLAHIPKLAEVLGVTTDEILKCFNEKIKKE